MAEYKAAVVGCGNIYPVHADALRDISGVKLVAAVDIEKNRALGAAEKYNCNVYVDYQEMLREEDVDVVHICTPHYLHAPMAIKALENGKDVLVEKPLALNPKQGYEMIAAAEKQQKNLGVVFQNRFNWNSIKARKLLEGGSLGQIRGVKGLVVWHRDSDYYNQAAWRGQWQTEGGGVLINQAIHTLDLMQWLGGRIEAVKGHVDTRLLQDVIEVEDTAEATFYYENGAAGIYYATNCYSSNSPVRIEIECERGQLILENNELIVRKNREEKYLDHESSSAGSYKSYWGQGHKKLISNFYENLTRGTKNYVTGRDGVKSLEIIEGIYESSKTGNKYFM